MAPLILPLFTAFAGLATAGGAAAAGTAAAGAAAAATATAATAGSLAALQGTLTAASAIASIVGGGLGAYEAYQASQQEKLAGRQEELASLQRQNELKRDLVIKTGAARVAFAASGVDISSAAPIEADLAHQAAYETTIEKQNARIRRAQASMRSRQALTRGAGSLVAGFREAAVTTANYGLDVAARG